MLSTVSPDSTSCEPPRYARQRDLLFGAGCGLLCFGLFPFSAPTTGYGHDVASDFDSTTRVLSATFAFTGLIALLVACIEMPRPLLRLALGVIVVPLAIAVAMTGAYILGSSRANDVISVLHHSRHLSFDQELRLERAINHLYCNARTRELCARNDSQSAMMTLGLDSASAIEAACAHAQDPSKMPYDLDPLTLITTPTIAAMHWCGQYVATVTHNGAVDLTQSPYQQHHNEVIDRLFKARNRRRTSTKLLMVLEWFGVPGFVGTVWWLRALPVKIHAVVHVVV